MHGDEIENDSQDEESIKEETKLHDKIKLSSSLQFEEEKEPSSREQEERRETFNKQNYIISFQACSSGL